MKFCIVLIVLVAGAFAAETYSNKFDDVDVDSILQNTRILTSYIKCVMDEGPCTAAGRELKKNLPNALMNDCNQCNEKQKSTAKKVINHLKATRMTDWNRLTKKYDPEGKYEKRIAAQNAQ